MLFRLTPATETNRIFYLLTDNHDVGEGEFINDGYDDYNQSFQARRTKERLLSKRQREVDIRAESNGDGGGGTTKKKMGLGELGSRRRFGAH